VSFWFRLLLGSAFPAVGCLLWFLSTNWTAFLPLPQLLLEGLLFFGDEFELVDLAIGLLDLLVGAFEVKDEFVLASPALGLVLLEGRLYFLVGGLPAWAERYI
jgi:hypothetical protein